MPFLRSVALEHQGELPDEYPFTVDTIRLLSRVQFRTPVTFFAGGNGTGKSTLLEGIADCAGAVTVRDEGLAAAVPSAAGVLAGHLRLEWNTKTKRGFFLRAEDFLGYKRSILTSIAELNAVDAGYSSRLEGYGLELARGSVRAQRDALIKRYGHNPDSMSHGESFLSFFQARFTGPGLYLLDEPDTALSAQSVLGLIALLREMVQRGAQFVIATHNPILLAFPNATLISFDRAPATAVEYHQLEQVELVRDFLKRPTAYLRHL